jgi:hypothetical protein
MKRAYWTHALRAVIDVALSAALYRTAGARGMLAALATARAPEFWSACPRRARLRCDVPGLLLVAVTMVCAAAVARSTLAGTRAFNALCVVLTGIFLGAAGGVAIGAFRMPGWLPERAAPVVALLRAFSRYMETPTFLSRVSALSFCSNISYIASFLFCARALDGRSLRGTL